MILAGQTITIFHWVFLAVGLLLGVIIMYFTAVRGSPRKGKSAKAPSEIKKDIWSSHEALVKINKTFQDLYDFFDVVERRQNGKKAIE